MKNLKHNFRDFMYKYILRLKVVQKFKFYYHMKKIHIKRENFNSLLIHWWLFSERYFFACSLKGIKRYVNWEISEFIQLNFLKLFINIPFHLSCFQSLFHYIFAFLWSFCSTFLRLSKFPFVSCVLLDFFQRNFI